MFHCKQCDKSTIHLAEKPNHILHLLLSVVTAGVWLPIWLLIAFKGRLNNIGECTVCGREN
jgi:hypothetical protein